MGVIDNTWHHLCVLWKIRDDEVEVFKDGERKHVSTGFRSSSQRIGIEGIVKKYAKCRKTQHCSWAKCKTFLTSSSSVLHLIISMNESNCENRSTYVTENVNNQLFTNVFTQEGEP